MAWMAEEVLQHAMGQRSSEELLSRGGKKNNQGEPRFIKRIIQYLHLPNKTKMTICRKNSTVCASLQVAVSYLRSRWVQCPALISLRRLQQGSPRLFCILLDFAINDVLRYALSGPAAGGLKSSHGTHFDLEHTKDTALRSDNARTVQRSLDL